SFIDNAPLEIDSPYIEAQLFEIMGAQSNDLKYLFRSGVAPYKLERRALASWSLVRVAWQDGPYITQNSEATTLTPAAVSGVAVTVTASSIIGINGGRGFLSTDVGRLIRIDNGAAWGWGIIVTLTSTLIVDVHVKKDFAATTATADWRLGAWSDTTGWPKTGGFFEQRLYIASTDDQSQTLWASQTGDFENFKPDDDNNVVEDDDALDFTLSADSVGEIRWLSAGEDTLAIGTAGGEWVPSASGIVITPLDITIRRQTTHGSALIAPLRIDHVVLFVQKAKRKLREFVFNFEFDSFLAPDITRLAQHITAPGIGSMAFQQEPDSLVWAVRSDGKLLSLTFRRDEDVVGWARHDIGGSAITETIAATQANFTITGGSIGSGSITSITINGVEAFKKAIDFNSNNVTTAADVLTELLDTSASPRPSVGGFTGTIGPGPEGPRVAAGIGTIDLEFNNWNTGSQSPEVGDILIAWITYYSGVIEPPSPEWRQIFETILLRGVVRNQSVMFYKPYVDGDEVGVHTFTNSDDTFALFANEMYISGTPVDPEGDPIYGSIPLSVLSKEVPTSLPLDNNNMAYFSANPLLMCFITSDHFSIWENDFQPPTDPLNDGWTRQIGDDGGVVADFHVSFVNTSKTGPETTGVFEWSNNPSVDATVTMVEFAGAHSDFVPSDYSITVDGATVTIQKLAAPFGSDGNGDPGDPGEIVITTAGDLT
ncbi:hypothetical protein LCGC14_2047490, partial [marine sediment metagenome]